jgi:hypothetical protein
VGEDQGHLTFIKSQSARVGFLLSERLPKQDPRQETSAPVVDRSPLVNAALPDANRAAASGFILGSGEGCRHAPPHRRTIKFMFFGKNNIFFEIS